MKTAHSQAPPSPRRSLAVGDWEHARLPSGCDVHSLRLIFPMTHTPYSRGFEGLTGRGGVKV